MVSHLYDTIRVRQRKRSARKTYLLTPSRPQTSGFRVISYIGIYVATILDQAIARRAMARKANSLRAVAHDLGGALCGAHAWAREAARPVV